MKKTTYIKAVIGLMSLLMLTRLREFVVLGSLDGKTLIFTLVEAVFLIWGMLVLQRDNK